MKLLNKLITKTAIYKHLKDLYEQALKDNEQLRDRVNDLIDKKNEVSEQYHKLQYTRKMEDAENVEKLLKKIRARVNKLDKKDENVKEIKRLIKEVL